MKRDNARFFLLRLLLVLGMLWLAPVFAVASVTDLEDVDGKGYFLDEATGYIWMDVDNFFLMSYGGVEDSLVGTDFHIASKEEVDQLLASAGTNFTAIAETMGFSVRSATQSLIWGMYNGGDEANGNYQSYYLSSNNPTAGWGTFGFSYAIWDTATDLGAFVVNTNPPPPPAEEPPPPPVEGSSTPPVEESPPPVEPETISATVEIAPNKLHIGCRGYLVTANIELPDGYAVEDIDPLSLNIAVVNTLVVDPPLYPVGPISIGDHDDDGVADLQIKFDRQDILSLAEPGVTEIILVGELADGTILEGTASVNVIEKFQTMKQHNKYGKWQKVEKILKHEKHYRCRK